MTTTTLFSKKDRFYSLYKSTFRRNIGYFGLLCALLALFYPFQYAMEAFKALDPNRIASMAASPDNPFYLYRFYGLAKNFTTVSSVLFTMIVLLAPMILALVLGSYMHSKKAADVFHALPIKREMLLSVNAAVAMSYIAIPVVASNIAIALIQIAKFGFSPDLMGNLLLDTCGWLIAAFCIYTVTTFVCVCVGTVFDAFVFSGALLVSAPVLSGLILALMHCFLFGFQTDESIIMTILNLSPVTMMPARLIIGDNGGNAFDSEFLRLLFNSNLALIIYLLLGAALFVVAMKLYHNRHSEMAETTTSKGILQIVIKFLGTAICGIAVGMIFYGMSYPNEKMAYIVWMIIGGILAYAIIEIILNRGFKTLVKSLPLGVGMVAVITIGSVITMTGGFGYENRIPSPDSIASVEIGYMGRYNEYRSIQAVGPLIKTDKEGEQYEFKHTIDTVQLTDPQNIEAVSNFHKDVVEQKFTRNETELLDAGHTIIYSNTKLTYHLKNGRKLTRYYNGVGTNSLSKLAPLETRGEFLAQTHGAFFTDAKDIVEWTVSDMYGSKDLTQVYSPADSKALLEAIQADLTDTTLEELLHPSQPPIATVKYSAIYPAEGSERFVSQAYFIVTNSSQRTYKFLQKKGVLDSIKADLSKCYAVTAGLAVNNGHIGNGDSAILQINPDYKIFGYNELEEVKERIEDARKYREESPGDYYPDDYANKYGYNLTQLFEDQTDIEAMANAMVGSYSVGEPIVYANFYFEGASKGSPVLVPLSSLPKDLQDLLNPDFPK